MDDPYLDSSTIEVSSISVGNLHRLKEGYKKQLEEEKLKRLTEKQKILYDFAGQALQGLLSNSYLLKEDNHYHVKGEAIPFEELAVDHAKELIKQLEAL